MERERGFGSWWQWQFQDSITTKAIPELHQGRLPNNVSWLSVRQFTSLLVWGPVRKPLMTCIWVHRCNFCVFSPFIFLFMFFSILPQDSGIFTLGVPSSACQLHICFKNSKCHKMFFEQDGGGHRRLADHIRTSWPSTLRSWYYTTVHGISNT